MKFTNRIFDTNTKDGIIERKGYAFDYETADGETVELCTYKDDNPKRTAWFVVDPDCGLSICKAETRAKAVEMAAEMRDKYTAMRNSDKYAAIVADFGGRTASAKPKASERKAEKPEAPKAEEPKAEAKAEDVAIAMSLEFMQEWCKRGNMVATQKREGCCIWVEGETKPFQDELSGLGFRWAPRRKGWYIDPTKVA